MRVIEQLYNQYNPWQENGYVFRKEFYPGPVEIKLRPFFIPGDFRVYNQWLNEEMAGIPTKNPEAVFSESYFVAVLESSDAQSLWGLINGVPAFEVDIYKALYYPAPEHIRDIQLRAEDIMMQLIIAPQVLKQAGPSGYILPACLEYLATYPGLEKVFLITDSNNHYYNELAADAGPISQVPVDNHRGVYEYNLVSFS